MATVLSATAKLACPHSVPITPTTSGVLTIGGSPVIISGTLSVTCTANSSNTKACATITPSGGDATALTVGGLAAQLSSITLTGDGPPTTPCSVIPETPAPLSAT